MKKPMKKGVKITLGILIALTLIGICFLTVAIYAQKELNKPRFVMPETEPLPSASALPEDAAAAESYIARLFAEAAGADDVEGSWHTEVSLDGDWQLPLTGADERVLRYMISQAQPQLSALYPSANGVCMAQTDEVPEPMRGAAVTAFTAQEGTDAEADKYILSLTKDLAQDHTAEEINSDILTDVRQILSPALEIVQVQITPQSVTETYKVDRVTDDLLSAEYIHTYSVRAEVRLTEAYRALLPEQETFEVELPYTTKQVLAFRHYGVRFTEQAVAVQPGDRQSLPATFTVNDAVSAEEYHLKFTPDVPDVLQFDEDGVMTVLKACDDPVTVTMTLEFGEHIYTDSITVYITEWEVASDV